MANLPPDVRAALDSVAGAVAGYWTPVNAPVEGKPQPIHYDEVDYGQAAHVLAALLRLGWSPPGGSIEMPEELARLTGGVAELPADGVDPNDPLMSMPLLVHLKQIRRLQALARFLPPNRRYYGTMIREWVMARLDEVEKSACPRCGCTNCSIADCITRRCHERGCPCGNPPQAAEPNGAVPA